jgi:hypothetical protein
VLLLLLLLLLPLKGKAIASGRVISDPIRSLLDGK